MQTKVPKTQRQHAAGITLVEVLALLVVLGLLLGLALPNYLRERRVAQRHVCIQQLKYIVAAKAEWAKAHHEPKGAKPTRADLVPYITHRRFPVCPAGGTYTINPIGTLPTCSLGPTLGHRLP